MADITAHFLADFTQFKAAVNDITTHLRGFETESAKIGRSLASVADSFSGRKLFQEVTLSQKAIADMGGVIRLTTAEAARYNAQLAEAIEKATVMGEKVEKAWIDDYNATKKAADATKDFNTQLSEFALTKANVVGGFIKDTIEELGKKIVEAAEAIPELVEATAKLGNELYTQSLRTNVSVEGLSKLRFIAANTGTSLSELTAAIFRMEANFGKGGKAGQDFAKMVGDMGLSLKELKAAAPEDALFSMLEAIGTLPTTAAQSSVGMTTFGRQFRTTANLIREDMKGMSDEAEKLGIVMTKEMAAMGRVTDDALTALKFQFESLGNRIGSVFLPIVAGLARDLSDGLAGAVEEASKKINELGGGDGFMAHLIGAFGKGQDALKNQIELYRDLRTAIIAFIQSVIEPFVTALGYLYDLTNDARQSWQEFVTTLLTAKTTLDGVALAMMVIRDKPIQDIGKQFATVTQDIIHLNERLGDVGKVNPKAGSDLAKSVNDIIEAGIVKAKDKGEELVTTFNTVLNRLTSHPNTGLDPFGGDDVDDKADKAKTTLQGLQDSLKKLRIDIDAAQAASVPLANITEVYGKQASDLTEKISLLHGQIDPVVEAYGHWYDSTQKATEALKDNQKQIEETRKATEEMQKDVESISERLGKASDARQLANEKEVAKTTEEIVKTSLANQNAARKQSLDLALAYDRQRGASSRTLLNDEIAIINEETRAKQEAERLRFEAALKAAGDEDDLRKVAVREHAVNEQKITDDAVRQIELRTAAQKSSHDQLVDNLDKLSKGFRDMATIGGSSFQGIVKQIATVIAAMKTAAEAGRQFRNALDDIGRANIFANASSATSDMDMGGIFGGGGGGSNIPGTGGSSDSGYVGDAVAGIDKQLGNVNKSWLEMAGGIMEAAAALGAFLGALDAATESGTALQKTINATMVGVQFGSAFGPIGAAIGGGVGALYGAIKGVTGPTLSEQKGRAVGDQFTQGLSLDFAQTMEMHAATASGASAKWATQLIAVRDNYLKIGLSEADAEDAVNRLHEAEKHGPAAAQAVVDEILKNFEVLNDEAHKTAQEIDDMVKSFSGDALFHQADVAVQAFNKVGGAANLTADETQQLHDLVQKAIDKYHTMGREVPADLQAVADATAGVSRETQGLIDTLSGAAIFKQAQDLMDAVNAVGGLGKLTTKELQNVYSTLGDAIDKYKAKGMVVPESLKAMFSSTENLLIAAGILERGLDGVVRAAHSATTAANQLAKAADDAFQSWARTYNYIKAGGSAIDMTKQALSPENYASFEDWLTAYVHFNTNAEGRPPSREMIAMAWRSNSVRPTWADDAMRKGYATGTGGRYLNFGLGTFTTLHGMERVSTAAEGRAEATAWSGMEARLASIERMLKAQPLQLRDAMMIAAGSRR